MKVVSDTTCIYYLLKIGEIELLPQIFSQVIVSKGVIAELRDLGAGPLINDWASQPPDWLEERAVPEVLDPDLRLLDRGERESIWLAEQIRADLLIIDERRGRSTARRRGLKLTGLLGVLKMGAELGLVDLAKAAQLLMKTNFHISPQLLERLLE